VKLHCRVRSFRLSQLVLTVSATLNLLALGCSPAAKSTTSSPQQPPQEPRVALSSVASNSMRESLPASDGGTYVSERFIDLLTNSKIFVTSMNQAIADGAYPIVTRNADDLRSVIDFHEDFPLDPREFRHNWTGEPTTTITDGKGNIYRWISDDTDFELAISNFYFRTVLGDGTFEDDEGHVLQPTTDGGERLNGQVCSLVTDLSQRANDTIDVISCAAHSLLYGIQAKGDLVEIYQVEHVTDAPVFMIEPSKTYLLYTLKKRAR
jgi:hypothetical protein